MPLVSIPSVLIADDDEKWRERIATILASEDCFIQFATNKHEALSLMKDTHFDLTILNAVLVRDKKEDNGWFTDWTTLMGLAQRRGTAVIVVTSLDTNANEDNMTTAEIKQVASEHGAEVTYFKSRLSFNDLLRSARGIFSRRPDPEALVEPQPKNPPPCVTWLHLSDLHFEITAERRWQIDQITKALRRDLATLREGTPSLKPDVIFFTGDLTKKAKAAEVTDAYRACLEPILQECSLGPRDLFVVPGNHDVDRNLTTRLDAGLVTQIDGPSAIGALLEEPTWAGFKQQLVQRVTSFQAALGMLADLPFPSGALSWGRTFPTDGAEQIGVIGLNSAWTSASVKGWDGEIDDQGKLFVGLPLLQTALSELPNPRRMCVSRSCIIRFSGCETGIKWTSQMMRAAYADSFYMGMFIEPGSAILALRCVRW